MKVFEIKPKGGVKQLSQVQSALIDKENVNIFMSALLSMYYDRLIGHARVSFTYLVQTGEYIEDDLKTGKIQDYQTHQSASPTERVRRLKKKSIMHPTPYMQHIPTVQCFRLLQFAVPRNNFILLNPPTTNRNIDNKPTFFEILAKVSNLCSST